MINFSEELKKYQSSLDKDTVEKIVLAEGEGSEVLKEKKVDQILKRYKLAYGYCTTGSYDLAFIQIQKVARLLPENEGVQMLSALICIHEGKKAQAKNSLELAKKVNPNNADIQTYSLELDGELEEQANEEQGEEKGEEKGEEAQGKKETKASPKKVKKEAPTKPQRIIATGEDYKEVTSNKKSFIYLFIGFLIGILAMFILVIPSVKTATKHQYAAQAESYEDQLKAKDSEISDLKKDLDKAKAETKKAKSDKESNTVLLEAAGKCIAGDRIQAAEKLLTVDEKAITSKSAKALYNSVKQNAYPAAAKSFYQNGLSQWYKKNYKEAAKYLEKAVKVDSKKADYVYYLGRVYQADGQKTKAVAAYKKVVSLNSTHVADAKNRMASLEKTTAKKTSTKKAN